MAGVSYDVHVAQQMQAAVDRERVLPVRACEHLCMPEWCTVGVLVFVPVHI